MPQWARAIEDAIGTASPLPADHEVPTDWRRAFALPWRPLVSTAADRIAMPCGVDATEVRAAFTRQLETRVARLSARTLVTHMADLRDAGRLSGADGRQRFADFVRRTTAPDGLAALLTRYPVLARFLAHRCELAAVAHAELLDRYAADRADIVTTLLGGVDPGPLRRIDAHRGDPHHGGRTVSIVVFADGRRVVYRPRPVAVHLAVTEVAGWLDLRALPALPRPGYGWLAHVAAAPVQDAAAAARFYRRAGTWLAMLHVLGASDLHHQNLVAAGEFPVPVDLETAFHPPAPDLPVDDPAAAVLARSVLRTGLLPTIVVGECGATDISGLGGDDGQLQPSAAVDWELPGTDRMRLVRRPAPLHGGANRPRLHGEVVEPADHEADLLAGFRLGHRSILEHRTRLRDHLLSCADLPVRVVLRPSQFYATLLSASTDPAVLGDATLVDRLFDDALRHPAMGAHPALCDAERVDLWAGDIPLFTTTAGGTAVRTSGGQELHGLLHIPGTRGCLEYLGALGEREHARQEWVISASLATRRTGHDHRAGRLPGDPTASVTDTDPDRLLAAARAAGDQLVSGAAADGDRVNWLGVELVDERQWLVLPLGAGLGNGYLGVALFLATLSQLTGVGRYAEVAARALRPTGQLLDSIGANPRLVAAVGPGGLHGFGGIAYALSRLSLELADPTLRDLALVAVGLADSALDHAPEHDHDGRSGWADGTAGCHAAMTAVAHESNSLLAERVAARCAHRLAAHGATAPDPRTWPTSDPGWCRGDAGHLFAMSLRPDGLTGADLDAAVRRLADRPLLADFSLCHGELGIADVLTALAPSTPDAAPARRRHAARVLAAVDRHGPLCATPGSVVTPGLLNGLAGIGYGLLRLGFADRVPSALLLESAPRITTTRGTA